MKKHVFAKVCLCAVLCLSLLLSSGIYTLPAGALTPKETMLLSRIKPQIPKTTTSHPASVQMQTQSGTITFRGRVSKSAHIDDELMLSLMQQSLTAGYKSLDDVVNDIDTTGSLRKKFDADSKDWKHIAQNLGKIFGVDTTGDGWDLAQTTLDTFGPIPLPNLASLNPDDPAGASSTVLGAVKGAKTIWEAAKGDFSIKPGMPDALGIVLNGLSVTRDEYLRNQEKWKDLVDFLNAAARLRDFYASLDRMLDNEIRSQSLFRIDVDDMQIGKVKYDQYIECPVIYRCTCTMTKSDTSGYWLPGAYSGSFRLRLEVDGLTYDQEYDDNWAQLFNDSRKNKNIKVPAAPGLSGYDNLNMVYVPVSNVGTPTESYATYESASISVTVPDQASGGAALTCPIDALALTQSEYRHHIDRTISVKGTGGNGGLKVEHYFEYINLQDDAVFFSQDTSRIVVSSGDMVLNDLSSSNPDNGSLMTDMRPYMRLTLLIKASE